MEGQKTKFKLIEMPTDFQFQQYTNTYNNYNHFPFIIPNSHVEDTQCCTSNIQFNYNHNHHYNHTYNHDKHLIESKPKMNKKEKEKERIEKGKNRNQLQLQLTQENLIQNGFGFLSLEDKNERVFYWIEELQNFEESAFLPM